MSPYKVDYVEAGTRNLVHLISVICDIRFELHPGEDDERLDSLLWIARDLAEGVLECEVNSIQNGRSKRSEDGQC